MQCIIKESAMFTDQSVPKITPEASIMKAYSQSAYQFKIFVIYQTFSSDLSHLSNDYNFTLNAKPDTISFIGKSSMSM